MPSISSASPGSRYLMIAARWTENCWEEECKSIRSFLRTNPSSVSKVAENQMLQTINSPLPEGAVPLVVIHCYADVPSGTEYDLAFDPTNPDDHESTSSTLEFGVVMSRVVEKDLSQGWHQTAVMRFPNGMPKLFDKLPVDSIGTSYLGLCASSDFGHIKSSLANGLR